MTEDYTVESMPRRVRKTDLKGPGGRGTSPLYQTTWIYLVTASFPREEELAGCWGSAGSHCAASWTTWREREGYSADMEGGRLSTVAFFEMKASFNPVMHFADMIREQRL